MLNVVPNDIFLADKNTNEADSVLKALMEVHPTLVPLHTRDSHSAILAQRRVVLAHTMLFALLFHWSMGLLEQMYGITRAPDKGLSSTPSAN